MKRRRLQAGAAGDKKKRFLRLDMLQRGDVVLLREADWISRGIAKATRGRYAHAALVYEGGLWFESQADGIGFTWRPPSAVEADIGSKAGGFLLDVSKYAEVDVFRHPGWKALSQERKVVPEEKLEACVLELFGREYAPWDVVVSVAGRRPVLGLMARIADVLRSGMKFDPGPFCSALVAVVYEEAGIDPFRRPTNSWETSPSDLADPEVSVFRALREIIGPATVSLNEDDVLKLSVLV